MNVGASINTCCDKCKGICLNIESQFVKDALYAGKVLLSDNSLKKNAFVKQGYIKGILCKDKELSLTKNIELLEKYLIYNKIEDFQKCLCDNDISQLIDNILGIADISCCLSSDREDLIIDESGYEQWAIQNPNCLVYDSWEAAFLGICTKFNLEKVFFKEDAKVLYQLSIANIPNKCNLIFAINVQNDTKIGCDLNYNVIVSTEQDCKLEYEAMISQIKCDLTFKTYVDIRKCGVKAEAITELVKCGLKIEPNVARNSCDIIIDPSTKITLCDYKFNIDSKNINCKIASDILGVELCE
jgi:hypothetical protein